MRTNTILIIITVVAIVGLIVFLLVANWPGSGGTGIPPASGTAALVGTTQSGNGTPFDFTQLAALGITPINGPVYQYTYTDDLGNNYTLSATQLSTYLSTGILPAPNS